MLTPPFVDAAYSDDGRRVAGVGLEDVEVWDTRRARLLFGVENGSVGSVGVATDFSPDGKHFVAASTDSAAIWTMLPAPALINKRSRPLRGLVGPVHDVRYSRDGARIVTAGGDKTVRIWDATTGEQLRVIRGAAAFNAAAFSGNGKRIAAASVDGTVRMLAAGSGQELLVFRGHGGAVNDVNFSRDGRFLVTASDDKTARVWDARTGLMIAVLRGHTDSVRTAQFGPVVGNAIVTASRDGTARVYPRESFLPYEQIRAIADRRAAVPLTEEERREFERLRRE